MKILKILDKAELILVDLEVNLGKEVRNAPTLCVRYKGKIIPLNTAHDGRPILMNEENDHTKSKLKLVCLLVTLWVRFN